MGLAFVVPAFPSRTNLRMKAPSKLVNEHYISHRKKLRLHGSVIMNFSESWLVSDTQLQPHWKYEETKQHSWLPAIVVSVMLKCWCFLQVLSGFAQQWNAVNWYISQMPNRKFCGICFLISHNLNWGRWTTWQRRSPLNGSSPFRVVNLQGFATAPKPSYFAQPLRWTTIPKIWMTSAPRRFSTFDRYSQIVMLEILGAQKSHWLGHALSSNPPLVDRARPI